MASLTQLSKPLQTLLTTTANHLAVETGFIQRSGGKLTGAGFAQTLVFSFLAEGLPTRQQLSVTAKRRNITVSSQGLDQRFNERSAHFMRELLAEAVQTVIKANEPTDLELLRRFEAVWVLDSSNVTLPDTLKEVWPGCGGGSSTAQAAQAVLKFQLALDLVSGALQGPELGSGRSQDHLADLAQVDLPKGALRLADLGYFSLDRMAAYDRQQVYVLSKIVPGIKLVDQAGKSQLVGQFLKKRGERQVDVRVKLGATKQWSCRLLALRLPKAMVAERRRKLYAQARREGKTVGAEQLELTNWFVWVTNIPAALLSVSEALVVGRLRWQIELLFKQWKSQSKIDEWRTEEPLRLLSELYAKLLAALVKHWLLVSCCWLYPDRSLFKAGQVIEQEAVGLARVFDSLSRFNRLVAALKLTLATTCRLTKRKKRPNSYQLLLKGQAKLFRHYQTLPLAS